MNIRSGRAPARGPVAAQARRTAVARLRGAAAGSVSGALSVAAHGWASGGMPLQTSTLTLLIAGATVVGTLVSSLGALRGTAAGLVAALFGGQLLGHSAMSIGMMHMPHVESLWTPAMLGAHLLAAVGAAIVILGAEGAYRIGTAVLTRVLPGLLRAPAIAGPTLPRSAHRDRVILRILAADTRRTRAPPLLVRV
ncbi:hypothetical protein NDR87_20260 [Nocardia sp. CDC159]|uniref:Uncharacterized protein n=1 Tax=Nocardia pulmonis TaxID=2951408 RepID=A0A9X2EB77_9NOCA|nr:MULTISPECIES: hypothetical protein [Nocardia]MCM6776280.1 hypothetical protein [Nocardia pulmonis]MCM6788704.1 hypothetical protein [Nocardia sp. CDC159]